ncbi:Glycoside hydrolase family 18 protein [Mycena venus]|uniref:Glycoside hydrolase family 18 protein n=1 Tax=Mycena venus TaxID=2733690 RepID=A0A8H6Y386_9AGAR|nr:Glycoside hydrolase family 18 protein [Mycena venus]
MAAAHAHGIKASVSIGGWVERRDCSQQLRTLFVKTLVNFAKKYNLDGLDFDWEYPASQEIGCNTMNANDAANFLAFIQELRADPVGSKLVLSTASAIFPFTNRRGNPSADVSAFSKVLDYIAIMNYDINAPEKFQAGSAVSGVKAWNAAGIPLNQLVLGVASYGHSFSVSKADAFKKGSKTQIALYSSFNASVAPAGDAWDDVAGVDDCGNFAAQGGVINFWGLIQQGYLTKKGAPVEGVPYLFDNCTQTPYYVYNTTTEAVISFDNAQSFAAKGIYIKSKGLGGFSMWEAGGDSNDILLDSIREAAWF